MKKLKRFDYYPDDTHCHMYTIEDERGDWCTSEDVAQLEASHAELLEALNEIVDQTDGCNQSHIGQDRAYNIARAAIAKVKGEPL